MAESPGFKGSEPRPSSASPIRHSPVSASIRSHGCGRLPTAWSPGAPALPGPCYWLVASWIPLGWRGGCLALRLGRGAVRHYCLGGCSALVVCARRSRPVRGARAGTWCRVFPVSPFPGRVSCAVCGGLSRPSVPYPCSLVRHSMRSVRFRVPRVALLVVPACPLCVCALALPWHLLPPPLPWLVWRAHLGWSRCRALVGPFHAVRAPLGVVPRSRAPFGLLWGEGGPVPFPPYLAWGCALPVGWVCASGAFLRRGVGGVGGGGAFAPCPLTVPPGGPGGRGVAPAWSVILPSLGRQQSGCHWRCSGHGGRGPHTAPVRARLSSPGAVRVAPWRVGRVRLFFVVPVGAGNWGVGAGPNPASFAGAAVLPREGGIIPSAPEGWGPAPPRLAGRCLGGQGAGVAPLPPCPLSGGATYQAPLPFASAFPPGVRVRSGSRGSSVRRVRPAAGGGGGGASHEPPPRRLRETQPVPLPSLSGQLCGRHWRCSGHAGPGLSLCAAPGRCP